jgi:hypothetical protein
MLDNLYTLMQKLDELSTELQNVVGPICAQATEMEMKELITAIQYLKWMKTTYEDMTKMIGSNPIMGDITRVAFEKMENLQVDEVLVNGERWKPVKKRNYSCSEANMMGFMGWARATDSPVVESIKESIHPKALESFLNGVLDNGGTLPPFVTMFEQPTVKSTKVKS